MKKVFLLLLLSGSIFISSMAQSDSKYSDIAAIVFMDSVVVSAKRQGFNVEEFILLIMEDESFYQAFKNLRTVSYEADNQISFYDKKGRKKSQYTSKTRQGSDGRCRTMEFIEKNISKGFLKKNKEYKYYTAKLFDRIFYTYGQVCLKEEDEQGENATKGSQKHISELKKLMFQPGQKANVPLIGKKTAIFDAKMAPYYDYELTSGLYHGEKEAYVFKTSVKPEFLRKNQGKTVIKSMETFVEKGSLQVLGRNYRLAHKTAVYNFDVSMEVELTKHGDKYLPELISYDGFWNIPTKKAERGKFVARFDFNKT